MNAGVARDFMKAKTLGGSSRPIMYKKDVLKVFLMQELLVCTEDLMFHRHESGHRKG